MVKSKKMGIRSYIQTASLLITITPTKKLLIDIFIVAPCRHPDLFLLFFFPVVVAATEAVIVKVAFYFIRLLLLSFLILFADPWRKNDEAVRYIQKVLVWSAFYVIFGATFFFFFQLFLLFSSTTLFVVVFRFNFTYRK